MTLTEYRHMVDAKKKKKQRERRVAAGRVEGSPLQHPGDVLVDEPLVVRPEGLDVGDLLALRVQVVFAKR